MHEIAGLGELREPWHSSQMSWLENHLNLINTYTTALENLNNYRGKQLLVVFFFINNKYFQVRTLKDPPGRPTQLMSSFQLTSICKESGFRTSRCESLVFMTYRLSGHFVPTRGKLNPKD